MTEEQSREANHGDFQAMCHEFAARWQQNLRPRIEDFVADLDGADRSRLLRELLLLELFHRAKSGELPTTDDYAERFPGDGPVIEEAFSLYLGTETIQGSFDSSVPTGTDEALDVPGENQRLGNYEIVREIARGGMGVVYEARQIGLNRVVALKTIASGGLAGREEIRRFQAEAEAAAGLDHPNIVPVFEVGESKGQHFFSMGLVRGMSLADAIRANPISAERSATLLKSIAAAVAYAHGKGIVHRDLKPGNVLLDENGVSRITDFGLARRLQSVGSHTVSGQVLGTPSYMPPEQALGQAAEVGPLADVYSLGAVLYHLLTGRPPFRAANIPETLRLVVEEEPVAPRRLDPSVPLDLETICLKCLEKSPSRRYESAEALANDLGRFLNGEPITARPVSQFERAVKWARRHPARASLVGVSSIAAIVVVVGSLWFTNQLRFERNEAKYQESLALDAESRAEAKAELEAEARKAAEAATRKANRETVRAENETRRAEHEATIVRTMRYAEQVAAARDRLSRGDVPAAMTFLDATDAELRSWEFDHLLARCRSRATVLSRHVESIGSIRFNRDGTRVLSNGVDSGNFNLDCTTRLWDPSTGELIGSLRSGSVRQFVASAATPDDESIITISRAGTVYSGDARHGWWRRFRLGANTNVEFDATGRFAVVRRRGGILRVYDATLDNLHVESDYGAAFRFRDDTAVLAAGGAKGGIKLFDTLDWSEIAVLEGHTDRVAALEFSATGHLLASAATDGTVKVWDLDEGGEPLTLEASTRMLAIRPDGGQLAASSPIGTVHVWDVVDGRELVVLGHASDVAQLTYTRDGSSLITAAADGTITAWNTGDWFKRYSYRALPNPILSQNGQLAASVFGNDVYVWPTAAPRESIPAQSRILDDEGRVAVWSLEGGEPIVPRSDLREITTGGGLEWSAGTVGRATQIRRADSEEVYFEIPLAGPHAFDGDGDRFAVFEGRRGALYEVESKAVLLEFESDTDVERLTFTPSGGEVVTGGSGALRVWNTHGERPSRLLGDYSGSLLSLAIDPGGEFLAVATTREVEAKPSHLSGRPERLKPVPARVRVLEIATGQVRTTIDSRDLGTVAFSRDGRFLSVLGDGASRWDTGTWENDGRFPDDTYALCASRDGRRAVVLPQQRAVRDNLVRDPADIRDFPTGLVLWTFDGTAASGEFGADGRSLVLKFGAGPPALFAAEPGGERATLGRQTRPVRKIVPSPKGDLVASCDGVEVQVRSTAGNVEFTYGGRNVAFDRDGSLLVRTSDGVDLLDSETWALRERRQDHGWKVRRKGKQITSVVQPADAGQVDEAGVFHFLTGFERGTAPVRSLDYSEAAAAPDGRRVAFVEDRIESGWLKSLRVVVLDAVEDEVAWSDGGFDDWVYDVAFSRDGQLLAAGCADHGVVLYDAGTGQRLHVLEGHRGPVYAVSFSHDGRRLVSGSHDGTVGVWDVESGECVTRLIGHTGPVRTVTYDSDGVHILSGGDDRTVVRWAPVE